MSRWSHPCLAVWPLLATLLGISLLLPTGCSDMLTRIPSLGAVMTAFPYAIEEEASLADARAMMNEHDVHHLPVVNDGELVGILDDRNLLDAERARCSRVGEACARDPFVVDLGRRLDGVMLEMAEHRADAVVVTRQGKLVGILTQTDICRFLGRTLRDVFGPPQGDSAA